MDLVAGVRKEGSRGGRANFTWEDVKDDQHRENYLGHSLMAPVGRWQKNRDLSWYAKGDESAAALSAAEARKEEIRKIKQAEQNALSEALGYGPMPKENPNEVAVGSKDVAKALKETTGDDDVGDAKGVGFGAFVGGATAEEGRDVLDGEGMDGSSKTHRRPRRRDEDGGRDRKRRRSRSRGDDMRGDRRHEGRDRDRSRERKHRRHRDDDGRSHRRHTSRSRSRSHHSHRRERSRSHDRRRDDDRYPRSGPRRSYSPEPPRRRRYSRDRQRL